MTVLQHLSGRTCADIVSASLRFLTVRTVVPFLIDYCQCKPGIGLSCYVHADLRVTTSVRSLVTLRMTTRECADGGSLESFWTAFMFNDADYRVNGRWFQVFKNTDRVFFLCFCCIVCVLFLGEIHIRLFTGGRSLSPGAAMTL